MPCTEFRRARARPRAQFWAHMSIKLKHILPLGLAPNGPKWAQNQSRDNGDRGPGEKKHEHHRILHGLKPLERWSFFYVRAHFWQSKLWVKG